MPISPTMFGTALLITLQSFALKTENANAFTVADSCNPPIETRVTGDFHGWDGETAYKMDNGQIWKQKNYHYHYHYAFHPGVLIYQLDSGACHIQVNDDSDEGVDVVRLK